MQINHLTYDIENPQPEGNYWCPVCRRSRHHSFYDSRSGWFWQVACDEEFEKALNEPDELKCDVCVKYENDEINGVLG